LTENALLSFIFRLFILLKAYEVIFMKRKPLFSKQEAEEFNFEKHQNMNCKGFRDKTFHLRNMERVYFIKIISLPLFLFFD